MTMNIWNVSTKLCLIQSLHTTSCSTHQRCTIIKLANHVVLTIASIGQMSQYFRGYILNIKLMQMKQNQLWNNYGQILDITPFPCPITFRAKLCRVSLCIPFPDLFKNHICQCHNYLVLYIFRGILCFLGIFLVTSPSLSSFSKVYSNSFKKNKKTSSSIISSSITVTLVKLKGFYHSTEP